MTARRATCASGSRRRWQGPRGRPGGGSSAGCCRRGTSPDSSWRCFRPGRPGRRRAGWAWACREPSAALHDARAKVSHVGIKRSRASILQPMESVYSRITTEGAATTGPAMTPTYKVIPQYRPETRTTRSSQAAEAFDQPDAEPLGLRRVFTQVAHDLYGTKDVQDAITASYVWMADQIGHISLGLLPTLLFGWIWKLLCAHWKLDDVWSIGGFWGGARPGFF